MISLTVMTGKVTGGSLTLGTLFKLWLMLVVAKWLRHNHVSYRYIFPQGANKGPRPCDLMSRYVMQRDPKCWQVHVPESGVELVSRAERVAFVEQVAKREGSRIFGLGMLFHPSHFQVIEEDDVASATGLELGRPSGKVVQFKRKA